jgi:predicted 3-demethylubiquinone-9 3-methyltransferase (glyoxalase superfamily)
MQRITPFLWFDTRAEDAAKFYTSVFRKSKLGRVTRYGDGAPMPKGTVMTAPFKIEGMDFVALNGGPHYKITPAVSFVVNCATQKEVDYYWDRLVAGGEPVQCGWLTDKFGVSWQIVPTALIKMLGDKDPRKASRVMKAMLKMIKLDLPLLQRAYRGV